MMKITDENDDHVIYQAKITLTDNFQIIYKFNQ